MTKKKATTSMPSTQDIMDVLWDIQGKVTEQNGRLSAVEKEQKAVNRAMGNQEKALNNHRDKIAEQLTALPCITHAEAIATLLERTTHPDPQVAVLGERTQTHRWFWTVVVGFVVSILVTVANMVITHQAIADAIRAIGGP